MRLGLRELIGSADGCDVVAEPTDEEGIMDRLLEARPDVVLLDLEEGRSSNRLARAISSGFPAVMVIACSSDEPKMRVFPPYHHGESYVARLSPEALLETVRQS